MALIHVDWPQAWRIIPSRYPPINLFERLTEDATIWDALLALEQATNPRLRQEAGQISLVPPQERVSGPGASYVMASFTHLNAKGSRFTDGSYGVYYAAAEIETAIAETIYHFEAFARAAHDPPRREDMRVLFGSIKNDFENVESLSALRRSQVLSPDSYSASQEYAKQLRVSGSNGIHYPSVRNPAGHCIAAFRPKAVGIPVQERHLQYAWNGQRVDKWFDYERVEWRKFKIG